MFLEEAKWVGRILKGLDLKPEQNVLDIGSCLEHVADRESTLKNICHLTKMGGTIIVTVPQQFPYHAAPIDNMYRPMSKELQQLFPEEGFELIRSEDLTVMHSFYKENVITKFLDQALIFLGNTSRIRILEPGPYMVTCIVMRKIK